MINYLTRYVSDPVAKRFFENIVTPGGRFSYICISFTPFDEKRLHNMAYDLFLKTVYWFVVKEYVICQQSGKCSRCGLPARLNVHHLSYEHHGCEHQFLEDLEVLCNTCHKQEHVPIIDVESIFRWLALAKKFKTNPLYKNNPNYDPRTMLNLKYFGDIRGKQYAEQTEIY